MCKSFLRDGLRPQDEHGKVTYLQQVNKGGFYVLFGNPKKLTEKFFAAGTFVAFIDFEGVRSYAILPLLVLFWVYLRLTNVLVSTAGPREPRGAEGRGEDFPSAEGPPQGLSRATVLRLDLSCHA
jgi:hypothetical protein